jgi:hypothetical protein
VLLRVPAGQADAILGAMRAIALEHGPGGVTDLDRGTIAGAATIVLGREPGDPEAIAPVDPGALARELPDPAEAEQAVRAADHARPADLSPGPGWPRGRFDSAARNGRAGAGGGPDDQQPP